MPDVCLIFVDVRFAPTMTPDSSLAGIRGALDGLREQDPDLAYEIEFPVRPERRINREVMAPPR